MDKSKEVPGREHAGLRAYWEFCYPSSKGIQPLFPHTPEIPSATLSNHESIQTHRKNLGQFAEMGEYREALFAALALLQDPPAVENSTMTRMCEELNDLYDLSPGLIPTQASFLVAVEQLREYWEMRAEALLIMGSIARQESAEQAGTEESVAYALRHSAAHRDEFITIRTELFDAVPVFLAGMAALLEQLGESSTLPLWRVKLLQGMVQTHLEHRDELQKTVIQLANRVFGQ